MALLTEEQAYDLCTEFDVVVERNGKVYELWDNEGYTLIASLTVDDFTCTGSLCRHLYDHMLDRGRELGKRDLRRSINELLGLA